MLAMGARVAFFSAGEVKNHLVYLSPSMSKKHRRQNLEHRQPRKSELLVMADDAPKRDGVLMHQLREDVNRAAVH